MFTPGDLVDNRYDILGLLGHGGMAQVFRARDRHLQRDVALKVLRPHLTETDAERFRREIRALAQLSHPGIVSIFDLGLGDSVYFAMELIDGGPFTNLGPLEMDTEALQQLLAAAIMVAETLGYVHHLGMVHRDLTPRNILLTQQGSPKVMDFGLVQLTETSQQLTRTGFTLGTPLYMAPEQATGNMTGAHTDLYSFGAVLYRTITGSAPFEAENDQAVLYQHVYGDVAPPTEINPLTPPALSELILALLAKEPEQRPSSGYAVADALKNILNYGLQQAVHLPLGGPARRGVYGLGPATTPLRKRWQIHLPEGPQWPSGMAAAAGFILIGARDDRLAVLRTADGGIQRYFDTGDEVSMPPLFAHQRVYVISRDGALTALAWPQGEHLWTEAAAEVVGMLPFGDGLLLTHRSGRTSLMGYDRSPRWSYDAASEVVTAPTLHRGQLLFFTRDGWLHSLEPRSGHSFYKVRVGQVVAPPTGYADVLLLPERAGALHAFDADKLEVMWTYDIEGELWASPVVWRERVFLASWSNRLHCLSLKSGDDLWSRELPGQVTASPILASGALYVATESGHILAMEARSGHIIWQEQVAHHPFQASPLPFGDRLITAALDGTVTAYGI